MKCDNNSLSKGVPIIHLAECPTNDNCSIAVCLTTAKVPRIRVLASGLPQEAGWSGKLNGAESTPRTTVTHLFPAEADTLVGLRLHWKLSLGLGYAALCCPVLREEGWHVWVALMLFLHFHALTFLLCV